MRRPVLITSRDNPRVKDVIKLRKGRDRRQSGLFVAEGFREIGRAIEAGLHVRELFVCPADAGASVADAIGRLPRSDADPAVLEVPANIFGDLAYCENPQGILAVFEAPGFSLDAIAPPQGGSPDLFLVAAGTNKPGNLGAMARTASAAGATAVLAADAQVDPFNPNAIRASTGAVFTLPVICETSERILAFLRARKVEIVAATPDAKAPYTEVDLRPGVALVIGAEDTGVNEFWTDAATRRITIPMKQSLVDSLNASIAAGILLFEAARQRRDGGRG